MRKRGESHRQSDRTFSEERVAYENRGMDKIRVASISGEAAADLAGCRGPRRDPEGAVEASAPCFRRGEPDLAEPAGRGGGRQGLRAAMRRLCRGFFPLHRTGYPGAAEGHPPDVRDPYLCRRETGHQDREVCRSVRQATLFRHGNGQRRGDPELPGRHGEQPRADKGGPNPGPAANAGGVLPGLRHSEPRTGLYPRGVCGPGFRPVLASAIAGSAPLQPEVRGTRPADSKDHQLHDRHRVRHQYPPVEPGDPLHVP
ncbi:MAG: hypothetical protein A4E72_01400 [Syntrophus sp. PtaU1.Bin208]|nr:MAG: hypothetical protein A4E72_01400 [Syntrophus sp. PtaU1.Bin208]